MSSFDPLIQDALAREVPLRAELEPAWDDVVARARGGRNRMRPRRWKPVLAAAVVTMALAGAGVAIAAGLGAFNGISAADHPQTGADILDPQTAARLQQNCSGDRSTGFYMPNCHLVLDSARRIGKLPSGRSLYVIADTRGDLCVVFPEGMTCGTDLSPSRPITSTSVGQLSFGVALDGVTAVSFQRAGREVTVPVKDNVWVYEGVSLPEAGALTAHFEDGTTVTLSP